MTDQGAAPLQHAEMAGVTKCALSVIAEVLPDDGHGHLTKIDIRRGWGNVLNIRLHTTMPRTEAGQRFGDQLRNAMSQALGDERLSVEIVWGAVG
jgi:hypothetical protein